VSEPRFGKLGVTHALVVAVV